MLQKIITQKTRGRFEKRPLAYSSVGAWLLLLLYLLPFPLRKFSLTLLTLEKGLNLREQDEYDSGHIPGDVLLPVGTIDEDTAAAVIPEKDATVLVYCRSGNRSKAASSTLAELGYTNIYEFEGINTWPYETEP